MTDAPHMYDKTIYLVLRDSDHHISVESAHRTIEGARTGLTVAVDKWDGETFDHPEFPGGIVGEAGHADRWLISIQNLND